MVVTGFFCTVISGCFLQIHGHSNTLGLHSVCTLLLCVGLRFTSVSVRQCKRPVKFNLISLGIYRYNMAQGFVV